MKSHENLFCFVFFKTYDVLDEPKPRELIRLSLIRINVILPDTQHPFGAFFKLKKNASLVAHMNLCFLSANPIRREC